MVGYYLSVGQEEPYESRDSRTDLWERGGEIPLRHPTLQLDDTWDTGMISKT
jgi:hypothetical protein